MKLYDTVPANFTEATDHTPILPRYLTAEGRIFSIKRGNFSSVCCLSFRRVNIPVYDHKPTQAALAADFPYLDEYGQVTSTSKLSSLLNAAENSATKTHLVQLNSSKFVQFHLFRGENLGRSYVVICPIANKTQQESWMETKHHADSRVYLVQDAFNRHGRALSIHETEELIRKRLAKCQNLEQLKNRKMLQVK